MLAADRTADRNYRDKTEPLLRKFIIQQHYLILSLGLLYPCHYWVRNSELFKGETEEMSRIIA